MLFFCMVRQSQKIIKVTESDRKGDDGYEA